jgi:hypothetical protein
MFRTQGSPYAAGMERIASVTNLLTLAPATNSRHMSIARACGQFTVKCLTTLAQGFVQAGMSYPYWIWMGPPPPWRTPRAPR